MLVFRVLGPLEIESAGVVLPVYGPRLRAILAMLVAEAGRVVSVPALVEGLWGAGAPPDAPRTVRTYVSRLRATGLAAAIATRPPGYRLDAAAGAVDAGRFERLARAGRRALADRRPRAATDLLASALGLWRGDPYAEFGEVFALRCEAQRLDQVRQAAVEDRIRAELARGAGAGVLADLHALTSHHPGRERLWGLLMTALYQAGRAADALHAYQRARTALAEGFGLDPSPGLADVHRRILAQDPTLLAN